MQMNSMVSASGNSSSDPPEVQYMIEISAAMSHVLLSLSDVVVVPLDDTRREEPRKLGWPVSLRRSSRIELPLDMLAMSLLQFIIEDLVRMHQVLKTNKETTSLLGVVRSPKWKWHQWIL